ncbi:hypothetical protein [Halalkalibacterium halodurans]|uniref:DUF5626 domain-containing protein n=1 Tax=Halalkalibacterium halodurans TaxID=86665 RepID=A0A0M0KMG8_ALKHA|nr:hypothetical protein [Halalkalibacterium halodurans]TPE67874.1 hypothetical protein AMD02_016365 [Halalkalibacterium halodurans]
MKRMKLGIIGFCVVALLVVPTNANAYSGSYSFDISYGVEGSKKHSLANKSTSTTARANTYWHSGEVKSSKGRYDVSLKRTLKTYTTSLITADGTSAKRNFGTVTKNDYTVRVDKRTGDADRIKGSGTINQ